VSLRRSAQEKSEVLRRFSGFFESESGCRGAHIESERKSNIEKGGETLVAFTGFLFVIENFVNLGAIPKKIFLIGIPQCMSSTLTEVW
jgi:hypothetical protein